MTPLTREDLETLRRGPVVSAQERWIVQTCDTALHYMAEVARLKAECDGGKCPAAQHAAMSLEQLRAMEREIDHLKADRLALVEAGVDEGIEEAVACEGSIKTPDAPTIAARVLAEFEKKGASDMGPHDGDDTAMYRGKP